MYMIYDINNVFRAAFTAAYCEWNGMASLELLLSSLDFVTCISRSDSEKR